MPRGRTWTSRPTAPRPCTSSGPKRLPDHRPDTDGRSRRTISGSAGPSARAEGLRRPPIAGPPHTSRIDRKQLVGLLPDDPALRLVEGAHIVETDRSRYPPVPYLGHVTSSYASEALGRTFALALVAAGRSRIGSGRGPPSTAPWRPCRSPVPCCSTRKVPAVMLKTRRSPLDGFAFPVSIACGSRSCRSCEVQCAVGHRRQGSVVAQHRRARWRPGRAVVGPGRVAHGRRGNGRRGNGRRGNGRLGCVGAVHVISVSGPAVFEVLAHGAARPCPGGRRLVRADDGGPGERDSVGRRSDEVRVFVRCSFRPLPGEVVGHSRKPLPARSDPRRVDQPLRQVAANEHRTKTRPHPDRRPTESRSPGTTVVCAHQSTPARARSSAHPCAKTSKTAGPLTEITVYCADTSKPPIAPPSIAPPSILPRRP